MLFVCVCAFFKLSSSIIFSGRHNNLATTMVTTRITNRSHSNSNNSDDENPFCALCSHIKTSVRIHHPWCSKNLQRDTEKVDELLNRIKHGVNKLQCNACQTEYQTGKQIITNNKDENKNNNAGTTMVGHNQACLMYQKKLHNERRQREKEEEESEQLEEEHKKARTMKKKKRVSTTATATSSSSRKSNEEEEEEDDDEDDGSVFQPAAKKARRMQALTFSRKSHNKQTVAASATANNSNSNNNNNNNNNSNNNDDDSRVKPRWVPLSDDEQDPWGEEGWQIEDNLLYGPQRGTGHLISNNRYAMNPFEIGSNYHRTHGTPEKGLSILCLTRDPLGKFPWGFAVAHHELGWACIIDTVHQNTPASAATFVGVPSNGKDLSASASLDINDMIMMINGKTVGGMSEVEFNLEIEMNSPNLILGISKYRHAETAERNFRILEQQLLRHQDSVALDDRMIGWQEIGNGYVPTAPVRTPLLTELRTEDVSLTTQDEGGGGGGGTSSSIDIDSKSASRSTSPAAAAAASDDGDNDDEAIATNTDPDDQVDDMPSQQQSKASSTLSSNVAVDDDTAANSSDNDGDEYVATATNPDLVPPQSPKQVAKKSKRPRAISALDSYCSESTHWVPYRDDNNPDGGDNHDRTIRKRSRRLCSDKVGFYCYCGRNFNNEHGLKINQDKNRCTTLASASAAAGKANAKNGSEDDDNNKISSNTCVFHCTCGRTFDNKKGFKIYQTLASASAAAGTVKASNESDDDNNNNNISSNTCVFDCTCGRTFDNEKGFKIHQTRMKCTTLASAKPAPTINNESEDDGNTNSDSRKQASSRKKMRNSKKKKKKKNTNNSVDISNFGEYNFFYCPTLILVSGGETFKQVLGSYALESKRNSL
jgi:hypothetical protein